MIAIVIILLTILVLVLIFGSDSETRKKNSEEKKKEQLKKEQASKLKQLTDSFLNSEFTDIILNNMFNKSGQNRITGISIGEKNISWNCIVGYNLPNNKIEFNSYSLDYYSLGFQNLNTLDERSAFTDALSYRLGSDYVGKHQHGEYGFEAYINYLYINEYIDKVKKSAIKKSGLKKTH